MWQNTGVAHFYIICSECEERCSEIENGGKSPAIPAPPTTGVQNSQNIHRPVWNVSHQVRPDVQRQHRRRAVHTQACSENKFSRELCGVEVAAVNGRGVLSKQLINLQICQQSFTFTSSTRGCERPSYCVKKENQIPQLSFKRLYFIWVFSLSQAGKIMCCYSWRLASFPFFFFASYSSEKLRRRIIFEESGPPRSCRWHETHLETITFKSLVIKAGFNVWWGLPTWITQLYSSK